MLHPLSAEIERLAGEVAAAAGLGLRDVQLLSHRLPLTLIVKVQRLDGSDISLDECAALSAPMAETLEAAGLLQDAYVLEVSSPGIGDELNSDRDFQSFRGFPVEVLCRDSDGAERCREGSLLQRDEEAVHLNVRGRQQRIPRNTVVRVRLVTPKDSS
ncbi:MAG: ribosome assembly cofactor RimP [Prochlorococcaceae cyanobacterium]